MFTFFESMVSSADTVVICGNFVLCWALLLEWIKNEILVTCTRMIVNLCSQDERNMPQSIAYDVDHCCKFHVWCVCVEDIKNI